MFEGNQLSVTSEVLGGIPESVAEDLLSITEYVHNFYPDSEEPNMDYANFTHRLIDHMYKSVKAYIDDPRPMSEKLGEEIEKELENLK